MSSTIAPKRGHVAMSWASHNSACSVIPVTLQLGHPDDVALEVPGLEGI